MGATMDGIEVLAIICGSLSIVGSLAVILTTFFIPELRQQLSSGRYLLILLSLCDLGQGIFFTMTSSYDLQTGTDACFYMGLVGIYTSVASFIATAWVAWWVHHTVTSAHVARGDRAETRALWLGGVSALLYPAVTLAALCGWAVYHYGKADWKNVFEVSQGFPWCFVTDNPASVMFVWRIVVEYGPLAVSMLFTGYYYVTTVRYIKRQAAAVCVQDLPDINAMTRKFLLIAGLYLLVRGPGMAARLISIFESHEVPTVLRYIVILGDPSQGFVNGLIFTFGTGIVRRKIKYAFFSICYEVEPEESMPINNTSVPASTAAYSSQQHKDVESRLGTHTLNSSLRNGVSPRPQSGASVIAKARYDMVMPDPMAAPR
ncbi:hypothetical protein DIPPA_50929 [Diplonema papillatum]|nr:hypothetical protein DIPPA_50929 [Diplonema papillatum]